MHDDKHLRALHRHATTVDAFAVWLRAHVDDLIDAAELLGGGRWAARAEAVVAAIGRGAIPVEVVGDLRAIHRLLHLGYADRRGSDEEARFAAVHPDDPRADNARRCAEFLDRGLAAIAGLERAGRIGMREAA